MKILMCLGVIGLLTGCGKVVRDAAVYQTEVMFLEQTSVRAASHLEKLLPRVCTCVEGKFVTEECRQIADDTLVIKHRVPWHKAMMLYNASLGDKPALIPPEVPAVETLCPESASSPTSPNS